MPGWGRKGGQAESNLVPVLIDSLEPRAKQHQNRAPAGVNEQEQICTSTMMQ